MTNLVGATTYGCATKWMTSPGVVHAQLCGSPDLTVHNMWEKDVLGTHQRRVLNLITKFWRLNGPIAFILQLEKLNSHLIQPFCFMFLNFEARWGFVTGMRLTRLLICPLPNFLLFSIHNSSFFHIQYLKEEITSCFS